MRTSYVVSSGGQRGKGEKREKDELLKNPPPPLKGAVVYREEKSNDREDKTAVLCAMLLTFPLPSASRNRTVPSYCISMHSPLHAAYSLEPVSTTGPPQTPEPPYLQYVPSRPPGRSHPQQPDDQPLTRV